MDCIFTGKSYYSEALIEFNDSGLAFIETTSIVH